MTKVQAVISRVKGEPVELTTIQIPEPGPNDVIVKIQACGVCHTDLAYQQGDIEDAYPFLLGHEAAGIVETVGERVTHVAPGDFVVLNWRAVCGECRACKRGEPQYCFNTFNASKKMILEDGTELSPALGIGAFAEKTLVHEGQCTKVNPDADPAAAGLLGCGIMAGLGAAINTGEITRGQSVAVIGCGGVGMAAIAGAHLAGATTINIPDTVGYTMPAGAFFMAYLMSFPLTYVVALVVAFITFAFGMPLTIALCRKPPKMPAHP